MPARVPILGRVAYPMHVLWCPIRIAGANALAAGAAMVVNVSVPAAKLTNFDVLVILAFAAAIHVYVVVRFIRDPHIEGVWRAKFFTGRRLIWQRTRNLVPFEGNRYEA